MDVVTAFVLFETSKEVVYLLLFLSLDFFGLKCNIIHFCIVFKKSRFHLIEITFVFLVITISLPNILNSSIIEGK